MSPLCVQLSRLLKDLKEAKEAQSPEGKLLSGLERKILDMELRHQSREWKLQQVTMGAASRENSNHLYLLLHEK